MDRKRLNQFDLIIVRQVDFPKEDLSYDQVVLQREDMNGMTSNIVWIMRLNDRAQIILKEIRQPYLIKPIKEFLEKQLLMPYYINEFVYNKFEKKLVERKVDNKIQYPFFGMCAAEV